GTSQNPAPARTLKPGMRAPIRARNGSPRSLPTHARESRAGADEPHLGVSPLASAPPVGPATGIDPSVATTSLTFGAGGRSFGLSLAPTRMTRMNPSTRTIASAENPSAHTHLLSAHGGIPRRRSLCVI